MKDILTKLIKARDELVAKKNQLVHQLNNHDFKRGCAGDMSLPEWMKLHPDEQEQAFLRTETDYYLLADEVSELLNHIEQHQDCIDGAAEFVPSTFFLANLNHGDNT